MEQGYFLGIECDSLGLGALGRFEFVLIILDVVAKLLVTRGVGYEFLSVIQVGFFLVPLFIFVFFVAAADRRIELLVPFECRLCILGLCLRVLFQCLGLLFYSSCLFCRTVVIYAKELLYPFPSLLDDSTCLFKGFHKEVPYSGSQVFYHSPHLVADVAEGLTVVIGCHQYGYQSGYRHNDYANGIGTQHEIQCYLCYLPSIGSKHGNL